MFLSFFFYLLLFFSRSPAEQFVYNCTKPLSRNSFLQPQNFKKTKMLFKWLKKYTLSYHNMQHCTTHGMGIGDLSQQFSRLQIPHSYLKKIIIYVAI